MNPPSSHYFFLQLFTFIVCTQSVPLIHSTIVTTSSNNYGGFSQHCNSTVACDSSAFLTCTGGTCQCESPSNQRYNQILHTCISNVGGHCSMLPLTSSGEPSAAAVEVPIRKCVPNAECVEIGKYTECQCKPGFIENPSGGCVPGIGHPCNYGPEECNPLAMVVCKNGRCECLDSLQVFDPETKRCVSPVGTICKSSDTSQQFGCVNNAICYPFYYWVLPRCLCKPGFSETVDRRCEPDKETLPAANRQQRDSDL